MSTEWMSIVEYARAFNVSDMTIRRRIKTGKLEAVLKDGKYFIPVASDHLTPGQNSAQSAQPSYGADTVVMRPPSSAVNSNYGRARSLSHLEMDFPADQSVSAFSRAPVSSVSGAGQKPAPNAFPSLDAAPAAAAQSTAEGTLGGASEGGLNETADSFVPSYAEQTSEERALEASDPQSIANILKEVAAENFSSLKVEITESLEKMAGDLLNDRVNQLTEVFTEKFEALASSMETTTKLVCDAVESVTDELQVRSSEAAKANIQSLTEKIALKNKEIGELSQKVEDMELLVKILEKQIDA